MREFCSSVPAYRREGQPTTAGPYSAQTNKTAREASADSRPTTSVQGVSAVDELTNLTNKMKILNQRIDLIETAKAIDKLSDVI